MDWGDIPAPEDLGVIKAITAGGSHTCAIKADGNVRCLGSNNDSQLDVPADLGPVASPVPICTEWADADGIRNPTLIGSYDNPVEAGLLERRQFEVPVSLRDIDPLCVKVTTLMKLDGEVIQMSQPLHRKDSSWYRLLVALLMCGLFAGACSDDPEPTRTTFIEGRKRASLRI